MKIEIVAVHPTTVIVTAEGRQFELPISAFPQQPQVQQFWTISLEHQPSDSDRIGQLNRYLGHTA